jgi:hypothetical protein
MAAMLYVRCVVPQVGYDGGESELLGGLVPTPDEYRRKAAECLRLAEQATDDTERVMLHNLATNWRRLADHKEKRAGIAAEGRDDQPKQ